MNYSPLIKICGLREPKLAQEAVELGAQLIGLVFYKNSKRYVELELAKKIAETVKSSGGIPVAVFVDADAATIKTHCDYCGINTVQLHGSISRRSHHLLPRHYRRLYVMTVSLEGIIQPDVDNGLRYLDLARDKILFDTDRSGSGTSFNLNNFSYSGPFSYFLAGGLTPQSVKNIVSDIRPNGVDVSSGVENIPGIKDKKLIDSFIRAAHG